MARCREEVSSEEYVYWLAYDSIEPIGPERQDLYMAQLCACVTNSARKSRSAKVYSAKDFIVKWAGTQQSVVEMQSSIRMTLQKQGINFVEAK